MCLKKRIEVKENHNCVVKLIEKGELGVREFPLFSKKIKMNQECSILSKRSGRVVSPRGLKKGKSKKNLPTLQRRGGLS